MYVCVCNAVTERHIVAAVREGSTTLRHRTRSRLTAESVVAPGARRRLRAALAEHTSEPAATPPVVARPTFPLALEAI